MVLHFCTAHKRESQGSLDKSNFWQTPIIAVNMGSKVSRGRAFWCCHFVDDANMEISYRIYEMYG